MEIGGDVGACDKGKSSQGKQQRSASVGQRGTPASCAQRWCCSKDSLGWEDLGSTECASVGAEHRKVLTPVLSSLWLPARWGR